MKQFIKSILAVVLSVAVLAVGLSFVQAETSVSNHLVFHVDYTEYDGVNTVDTVSGTTLWSKENVLPAVEGRGGKTAAEFDDQYNQYPRWNASTCDPFAQCVDGVTITMWVKLSSKTNAAQFFALQKSAPRNDDSAMRNLFLLQFTDTGFSAYSAYGAGADTRKKTHTTADLPLNEWVMVSFAQNAEDKIMKLYINGEPVNDTATAQAIGSVYEIATAGDGTDGQYNIGGKSSSPWDDRCLNGLMESFSIYNRELTAGELRELYSGESYADYSGVDAAIATIPADLSIYTEATAQAVMDARAAVIPGLKPADQATVDGYAAAIRAAVAGLELNITDEGDIAASDAVDEMILALPDEPTAEDAENVYAAAAAYNALSKVGKALVTQYDRLIECETKLRAVTGNAVIDNLVCHDDDNDFNWVVRRNAQIGERAYSDRRIYFGTLPDYLLGRDFIRTGMNSKSWNGGETLCEFDVYASTTVYVAWTTALATPDWLGTEAGFEPTGDVITTEGNDGTLNLYRRNVAAGEHIKLGSVNSNNACYVVFADNITPAPDPEPAPPTKELSRKVKVACVGDSITAGPYPGYLGEYLGESYEVKNFGVSGTTLLSRGNKPYMSESKYAEALSYQPDIVIIMLGTNDSKPKNNIYVELDYKNDYLTLVNSFKALPSNPKIYIATCPFSISGRTDVGDNTMMGSVMYEQLRPIQLEVIEETGAELVDMWTATFEQAFFPDSVHPDDEGYHYVAKVFYDALFDYLPEGVSDVNAPVEPQYFAGDVDKSGTVDVADIMKLKALIMRDTWSNEELAIGDLDESGKLDVGDIMAIKNMIMSGQ